MAEETGEGKRGLNRRQFLTITGAAAALGAVIFASSRSKATQSLLKPTQQAQQIQGRYVKVPGKVTTTSWLSKLLGGKL
ncbi:MAG: twin-arginine translocation signal domain-containing protein [Candidatus Thermoplasmatota archaeon]